MHVLDARTPPSLSQRMRLEGVLCTYPIHGRPPRTPSVVKTMGIARSREKVQVPTTAALAFSSRNPSPRTRRSSKRSPMEVGRRVEPGPPEPRRRPNGRSSKSTSRPLLRPVIKGKRAPTPIAASPWIFGVTGGVKLPRPTHLGLESPPASIPWTRRAKHRQRKGSLPPPKHARPTNLWRARFGPRSWGRGLQQKQVRLGDIHQGSPRFS